MSFSIALYGRKVCFWSKTKTKIKPKELDVRSLVIMKTDLDGFLLQEPFFKSGWTKYAFLNTIAPISEFSKIGIFQKNLLHHFFHSKVRLSRGLVICGRWNNGAEKKSSNAAVSIPLSLNSAQKVYLEYHSLLYTWRACIISLLKSEKIKNKKVNWYTH